MIFRNRVLPAVLLAFATLGTGCSSSTAPAPTGASGDLASLAAQHNVRLGVYAVDTGSGKTVESRADERFPMLSTFKTLACGALLHEHPLSTGYYDQVIHFTQADVDSAGYSPVTKTHVDSGMTVSQLCDAAITQSDNAAGNQVLKLLGGPASVTAFVRSLGDTVTRLDRWEPDLNTAIPGDERDTSTPKALANDYRALVLGAALGDPERDRLKSWLLANTTGAHRIRAGLPAEWKTGDKTGTGDYGSANDVAITWPAGGAAPVVIAVLSTGLTSDAKSDNAVVADAAKVSSSAMR